MQNLAGACSPEQLHMLQKIFDLIWMELRATSHSNYTGPSEPDALREEIARRVIGQFDGGLDADEITRRVLSSFGIEAGFLRSQPARGNGATKPDGGWLE